EGAELTHLSLALGETHPRDSEKEPKEIVQHCADQRTENPLATMEAAKTAAAVGGPIDPVTDRLSRAIDRASEAGQWTVVERLSEQLERHQVRQLEERADNVTRRPQRTKKPG